MTPRRLPCNSGVPAGKAAGGALVALCTTDTAWPSPTAATTDCSLIWRLRAERNVGRAVRARPGRRPQCPAQPAPGGGVSATREPQATVQGPRSRIERARSVYRRGSSGPKNCRRDVLALARSEVLCYLQYCLHRTGHYLPAMIPPVVDVLLVTLGIRKPLTSRWPANSRSSLSATGRLAAQAIA